uniref:Uncharacterized protein n=1 Tax=Chromera velia CCMP2878 TaxID=1169474 RepID=A0A0G4HAK4_9ALVE|eukprot:Cvel_25563.t1-p1 / transcript=Cvel_25563.t1 / gene=Cvel_25563 / organism=Chromera_velia_CCMP2878 / gene_product=hypothetical protein / transcript_product=hypothetical protein / location=Cvel_scaffold2913:2209-5801(+) / protein_length=207 / sequence_SO=supercontig / SO=protein_coding / is_pseudo=false
MLKIPQIPKETFQEEADELLAAWEENFQTVAHQHGIVEASIIQTQGAIAKVEESQESRGKASESQREIVRLEESERSKKAKLAFHAKEIEELRALTEKFHNQATTYAEKRETMIQEFKTWTQISNWRMELLQWSLCVHWQSDGEKDSSSGSGSKNQSGMILPKGKKPQPFSLDGDRAPLEKADYLWAKTADAHIPPEYRSLTQVEGI